ncbi:MAG TPA: D-glucuronyl C5-epimerase family protein [Candidatus Limnocylindria bacterium]|nr:D-glucuronyl C5-epimerase family protein [Candidatus Limnocylindria bacterium]
MLPPPSNPAWRTAPRAGGGGEIRYLPYGPPAASSLSSGVDWLSEDGSVVLLEDGYPAKLTDRGILVHPMHGRYVLEDVLRRHAASPSADLRAEIDRTARAIIGRSELRGDERRFWYEGAAASGLSEAGRHVSGLPQAYYASLLTRAASAIGDEDLAREADRFFAVLAIPVDEGGARYDGEAGPGLAMVPMAPRDWILNGWLSMLVSIAEYAETRPSPEANALLDENLPTLLRVLPAYDVPALRLSRYMLPGVAQLAIEVNPAAGVGIRDLRVAIPGESRFPIPRREATGWRNRLRPDDLAEPDADGFARLIGRALRFVAVLSRAAWPQPNAIELEVETDEPAELVLRAHLGAFDPIGSRMVDRSWQTLATTGAPAGRTAVRLEIPYEAIDLLGYPTSFARTYGGRRLNVYHATHVVRLRQLARATSEPELDRWAGRWRRYVDEWSAMPEYAGYGAWSPEGDL